MNLGLAVLTSNDAHGSVNDGEEVHLGLNSEMLIRDSDGREIRLDPMPLHVKLILDAGGLMPFVKHRLTSENGEREKR